MRQSYATLGCPNAHLSQATHGCGMRGWITQASGRHSDVAAWPTSRGMCRRGGDSCVAGRGGGSGSRSGDVETAVDAVGGDACVGMVVIERAMPRVRDP
jgi:hypothetical protein